MSALKAQARFIPDCRATGALSDRYGRQGDQETVAAYLAAGLRQDVYSKQVEGHIDRMLAIHSNADKERVTASKSDRP
jgi:hypothetical protein